jgi:putative endonuclease
MREHQYYVYMVSNRWDNVVYIGVTNSLEIRMWQHKAGTISGFTKQYNCDQLMYFELYDNIIQAIAREKQLKGWRRAKKDALIARMNPELRDLSAEWEALAPVDSCHPEPPEALEREARTPQDGRRTPSLVTRKGRMRRVPVKFDGHHPPGLTSGGSFDRPAASSASPPTPPAAQDDSYAVAGSAILAISSTRWKGSIGLER